MELNEIVNTIGDVYCPERELPKCKIEHNFKEDSREHFHFNCPKCDADFLAQGITFKNQTQQLILKDAGTHTFRVKTTRDYEQKQKERVENDKGMAFLRQIVRKKKPTNQRAEEPPAKKPSPCREMIVLNFYWLFKITTKSFVKQLEVISFQN